MKKNRVGNRHWIRQSVLVLIVQRKHMSQMHQSMIMAMRFRISGANPIPPSVPDVVAHTATGQFSPTSVNPSWNIHVISFFSSPAFFRFRQTEDSATMEAMKNFNFYSKLFQKN